MYVKMLERILLRFLTGNKIKMEIAGFDMDAFTKAMQEETKRRLDMVECIAFEDEDIVSDEQKVAAIKELFKRDFYYGYTEKE